MLGTFITAALTVVARAKGPNSKANAGGFAGGILGAIGLSPLLMQMFDAFMAGAGKAAVPAAHDLGVQVGTIVIGGAIGLVTTRLSVWWARKNEPAE